MLTGNLWNPPDANKIEEALSRSPQKQVVKKKKKKNFYTWITCF